MSGAQGPTGRGPHLVLVHGAWHGSWVWDPVVARLRDKGVPVDAVDLPGVGRAPGPDELEGHIDHLRRYLSSLGEPVVLCAHSYGGAVATAAATANVVELVYLSAFQLEPGESCADQNTPRHRLPRDDMAPVLLGDHLHMPPEGARYQFYEDCSRADADAAIARLTPEHRDTVTAPIPRAAWHETPSTYVVCRHDRAVVATAQRRMGMRATRTVEIEAGHSPMLSGPDEVTDVLLAVRDDPADAAVVRPDLLE